MMTRWYSGLPYVKPQFSEFIILVKTDNAGVSASNEILLPIQGSSMIIDWGDGNVSIHTQTLAPNNTIGGANVTHTYASAGIYQIKISPRLVVGGDGLHRIAFVNVGDRRKLLEIQNWGKCVWSRLDTAFRGCINMDLKATDIPNFSVINTNLINMFSGCTNLIGNTSINNWDVSRITVFASIFGNCPNFNQPLDNWDTSSATIIGGLFLGCTSFNQNVNNWDVSKVTTFGDFQYFGVFEGCTNFNQPLDNWNTSSGIQFRQAWLGCSSLTSFPLLNVSSGTNFFQAWLNCTSLTSFPLLNVSSGTNFGNAWRSCTSLTTFPPNMFDTVTATNFTNAFLLTALNETSIDNILVSINTANTSNGTFNQSGGSAPSSTGEAAIDALRSRGWTVTVTGGY
jgi:surface protein